MMKNNHGFGVVSSGFVKTDQEEDDWRLNQKENRDLMENWKRFLDFCS
jgi:hypothetical protein